MKRVAGLDIGDRRIGVAVSDPLGFTAQPVVVVQRRSLKADLACVLESLSQYDVELFVAGLPLDLEAREGEQARRVRRFAEELASKSGLRVEYQDERLTTVESERVLIESGMRRKKRRGVIDKVAATLILQAYLDRRASKESTPS